MKSAQMKQNIWRQNVEEIKTGFFSGFSVFFFVKRNRSQTFISILQCQQTNRTLRGCFCLCQFRAHFFQSNSLNTPKIIVILQKKSSVSQKCLIFNMKRRELLKNTLIVVTIFTINNNNILSGFLPVDKEAVCYSGDRTIQ